MGLVGDLFALRLWTTCLVLLLLFPLHGHAQSVMVGDIEVDPRDFSPDQDPEKRIASCLACHGARAGGDVDFGPDVQFGTPALRGMRHDYLKQSLIDYKTGSRPHEEMGVIAAMLNDETIDFMARAFAAYPAPSLKSADELAKLAEKDLRFRMGQAIAEEGRICTSRFPAVSGRRPSTPSGSSAASSRSGPGTTTATQNDPGRPPGGDA